MKLNPDFEQWFTSLHPHTAFHPSIFVLTLYEASKFIREFGKKNSCFERHQENFAYFNQIYIDKIETESR